MRPGAAHRRLAPSLAVMLSALVLGACASADFDASLARANDEAGAFTQGKLSLDRTAENRQQAADAAERLLASPLGQSQAIELALANDPALQAMLAARWAEEAATAQSGRIPNPFLSFTRLRTGDELELERVLSFGLLDLILLPQRAALARERIDQGRVQLTAEVVARVTQIREAWVRAVAARQSLNYAQQVHDSAEASAELARRMQAVGNFNRITRARQQVFYAESAAQLAAAQHAATAAREALVRSLGLTDAQAKQLTLPERLPDLPATARAPDEVGKAASRRRLDVAIARSEVEAAARAQGLTRVSSLTDIEIGLIRNTTFDDGAGTSTPGRGFEFGVRLPIFDGAGQQREAMNARTLAASLRLEATLRAAGSILRERYSAYRTAHDLARHYREEIVPLHQTILEESVLRYNAMLTGVFELLGDSRSQIASVIGAIAAEERFWLADAALQATIVGGPSIAALSSGASITAPAVSGRGGDGGH